MIFPLWKKTRVKTDPARSPSIDSWITTQRGCLYRLCESLWPDPTVAQSQFQTLLKKIQHSQLKASYVVYERPWVLKVAYQTLVKLKEQTQTPQGSPSVTLNPMDRLLSVFRRLPLEDQLILLLITQHRIPLTEISYALGLPEGSVKIKFQQALRTLEEWLWIRH